METTFTFDEDVASQAFTVNRVRPDLNSINAEKDKANPDIEPNEAVDQKTEVVYEIGPKFADPNAPLSKEDTIKLTGLLVFLYTTLLVGAYITSLYN